MTLYSPISILHLNYRIGNGNEENLTPSIATSAFHFQILLANAQHFYSVKILITSMLSVYLSLIGIFFFGGGGGNHLHNLQFKYLMNNESRDHHNPFLIRCSCTGSGTSGIFLFNVQAGSLT